MKPTVSICVPNLNTRQFLPERFASIYGQSFGDWELLVYDSYSTDGAWDFIRDAVAREPRARAWQGPREGAPASWNPCIREARGDYVYIATSDDTMAPDCLEKLVAALEANPDCDIAHCPVKVIDETGRVVADMCEWWWKQSPFARSSGALVDRSHVRYAPLDGALHLLGGSVYISVTQLLIRRALFDRIGYYESSWGSIADFNWNMRAGLAANTVHVPDTWGGWRVHANQATAAAGLWSAQHDRKVDEMIDHAIDTSGDAVSPAVQQQLSQWRAQAQELRRYMRELENYPGRLQRSDFIIRRLAGGSAAAFEHVKLRLRGRPLSDWIIKGLETSRVGRLAAVTLPHNGG